MFINILFSIVEPQILASLTSMGVIVCIDLWHSFVTESHESLAKRNSSMAQFSAFRHGITNRLEGLNSFGGSKLCFRCLTLLWQGQQNYCFLSDGRCLACFADRDLGASRLVDLSTGVEYLIYMNCLNFNEAVASNTVYIG